MPEHSEDFVMVKKSVAAGLAANAKRWRVQASFERLKRQQWRKRALTAEAEVKRLREALTYIAEHDPLLEANDHAFGLHAARRMQAQAQAALTGSPEEADRG